MLLQPSIEHVSIVYKCNTYFCHALVHVYYSVVSGQYTLVKRKNRNVYKYEMYKYLNVKDEHESTFPSFRLF